jgi:BirA family biotin operon repressor/biotin-[acetyl-CoA-carboxylase] ligase
MRVQLGSIARARGVRLFVLDETDSTNDEARRLIDSGERGPLWIVARRQTKGRGRLGRAWVSPKGNLHASFIFSGFDSVIVGPQLGFVAGVTAIRALRAVAGAQALLLKWPNDLLLDRAKLGGILLECIDRAGPIAILGIGVNIAEAPSGLPYAAVALSALGASSPSPDAFFAALSDSLVDVVDIWRGGKGFSQIREEWLSHAAGIGEQIRIALTNETLDGKFDTIDGSGRLVLAVAGKARAIEAGDVLLGPRRTEALA